MYSSVFTQLSENIIVEEYIISEKGLKQAGAELCQAQEKLGLAKLDLHSMKLCLSSIDTKH